MSKIYEALQLAQQERRGGENAHELLLPMETHLTTGDLDLGEEMLSLYKTIEALLPGRKCKTLQFIGTREGEGTSTIVREFAKVSATRIGRSVLLLDADRHQSPQKHYFTLKSEFGWIDALIKADHIDEALHQVGESRLFVSPSCNSSTSTPEIFDTPRFDNIWKTLRDRFELVLIDSPPLTISPDGLALASRVDGVILVLEAEKTRWQSAKNTVESLERVGAKMLGTVLNKRRYYIPEFIYKLL